jgi:hypothetical protein
LLLLLLLQVVFWMLLLLLLLLLLLRLVACLLLLLLMLQLRDACGWQQPLLAVTVLRVGTAAGGAANLHCKAKHLFMPSEAILIYREPVGVSWKRQQ